MPPILRVSEESERKNFVKTLRLLCGRDAQAAVAHADAREALIRSRRDGHRSAAGRILDRVGEQVGDHLADAIAVPDQRQRMTRRGELEPVTRGLRREEVHLLLQELVQVERFEREREAPRLQPLQIEEVVDQPGQALGLADDRLEVATGRVLVEVVMQQELREAEDGRQRGA